MCPGFRLRAVSMEGLEIAIAGVPSMSADVVNLQLVVIGWPGGDRPSGLVPVGCSNRPKPPRQDSAGLRPWRARD
jgi:hypothetical protein